MIRIFYNDESERRNKGFDLLSRTSLGFLMYFCKLIHLKEDFVDMWNVLWLPLSATLKHEVEKYVSIVKRE